MHSSNRLLRAIYDQTRIVRRPTYGIITGYHEVPFVVLGESHEPGRTSTRIRGKIRVSPQLLLRPPSAEARYDDIFGEEQVDEVLVGRVFGFLGFRGRPVECTSDHLEVAHHDRSVELLLEEVLEDIEYREDITVGVVVTPDTRYYPVSIERLIASILDDEFRL